ncbi:hypothetical protein SAMN04515671_2268 [Nakamurella panacisegetis]|uniref:Uncharacterized protein n=1 Tax=Nakamurella panacisegetis TaxID=1090615 RepID=A0A1H0N9D7_9ACTN|nr:hypothetical protein SAMN04515671_2268 [Nakamurella panacisegetis]
MYARASRPGVTGVKRITVLKRLNEARAERWKVHDPYE